MRQIIDGRLYNTETAHCVGAYRFVSHDDVQCICSVLYRNKQGEYFLCDKRVGVSMNSEAEGHNEQNVRESIIPMSVDDAKKWTERYLNVDEYLAEFGKPQGYYKREDLPQFSEVEMNFIAFAVVVPKCFPFFSVDDIPYLVKSAFRDRSNGFGRFIDVERTIKKVYKMNHWQRVEFFKRINAYISSL